MKPRSLKQRLFFVTGLALLPAVVVVVSTVLVLDFASEREVRGQASRAAEVVALELERVISGTENVLKTISAAPASLREDKATCAAFLQRTVQPLPALASLAIILPDGQVWCATDLPDSGLFLGDRPYFQTAAQGSGRVTGVLVKDRATGRNVLPIAWPYRDGDSQLIAVVVGYVDLQWLQTLVEERTHLPGSSLTIADRDGRILARYPRPEDFVGTVIPDDFQHLVNAVSPGTEEIVSQDGTGRILGYVPVNARPEGIYVSTGIAIDSAFSVVKMLATSGTLIAIAGILSSFWLARYTGRRFITRPFGRLINTVELWRQGNTQARSGMTAQDGEIGLVGIELDAFMDELLKARADQERLETQRKLMSRELDHRAKNLLAMVQAVARQTLASSASREDMAKFNDRLKAIGTANSLLLEDRWQAAKLGEVIRSSIAPFQNADGSNFQIQGPDLSCNSNACVALGMALHELCTNAAKYGALSTPGGHVTLNWSAREDEFVLDWVEEGGPPVTPPKRSGFGSTMIDKVLGPQLRGLVELRFLPSGLNCTLRCPRTELG